MAAGYSIPESDALGMLGDAHSTNYAENREFFLNQNNPTNFERTWTTAYFLYKKINAVTEQTPFDQVMDFSIIQKLGERAEVRQPEERVRRPVRAGAAPARSRARRTRSSPRRSSSTSSRTRGTSTRRSRATVDGKDVEELYDPNVGFVVEEVGKLAGQYGAARIVIEGHTDGSMKGQVPKSLVQELSLNRANAVKEAIVRKFPSLQPNQFSTAGHRLGPAGRSGRSGERREEPARRDQGLPGGGDAGRQVDAGRREPSLLALRISPPPMTRRLVGVGAVGVVVLLWWLATTGVGAEERLDLAGDPAEPGRSGPQLPEPAERARAARRASPRR